MDQNFQPQEGGSKAPVIIGVAVVVILIILGLYFWLGSSSTDITPPDTNNPPTATTTPVDSGYVQSVNVRHQFKSGTHTYVGSIDLPTPCETLSTEILPVSPGSKTYTLKFTSTKTSEVCAQVITTKAFKTTLRGTADFKLDNFGTLNGKKIRLNAFEVRPDMDIDNYDIYFKG